MRESNINFILTYSEHSIEELSSMSDSELDDLAFTLSKQLIDNN